MPLPPKSKETGGRLTGADMNKYFESFADTLLPGKILYNREILNASRRQEGGWKVLVKNKLNGGEETLHYDKIVVCTGVSRLACLILSLFSMIIQGCSEPSIPENLRSQLHRFHGPIFHSSEYKSRLDDVLAATEGADETGTIVVVGGGKSAQEYA